MPLTAGIWLGDLWLLPLAFLLAGFPLGRLDTRLDRLLVGALAVVMLPLELLWLMFLDFDDFGDAGVPRNVLLVADEPQIAERDRHRAADHPDQLALPRSRSCSCAASGAASAPLRRVLAPVLAGAAGLGAARRRLPARQVRPRTRLAVSSWRWSCSAAVPIIFLVGLLRARLARSSIGDLLVDLREPAEPGALRDALARALRDPSLELAYWVPGVRARTSARTASRSSCPETERDRVTTFVERGDTRVAALIHDASLKDEPQLVGAVDVRRRASRSRTSACRRTCARA